MAESVASSVWEFDNEVFDFAMQQPPQISDEEVNVFRDIAFKIRHPDGKREVPWPNDCIPKQEKFGGELAIQYIYEWEKGNKWARAYEVEVCAFIGVKYMINFEGTENYDIQGTFPLQNNKITVDLQPFERVTICMISCDTSKSNQFKVKGSWNKCDIHPQLYQQSIVVSNNKIKSEYDACLEAGINETVSWKEMANIVRNNGLLFVDGEMYPCNESLYVLGDDAPEITNKNADSFVMWRRVGDFIKGWPAIFKNLSANKESVQPIYARMGNADDAWLVSVISVLGLRPDLISNLFLSIDGGDDPSTNTEDKMFGFYRMKICWNGIWTECILDDLFPCKPYWLPVMTNCADNDQVWPHLIEKLMAKMRGGCYELLDGGSPSAAFTDLTGCPTEEFDLRQCDTDVVFDKINESYNNAQYNTLAVAICNEDNDINDVESNIGLLSMHSYSVLAINMDYNVICLRDPFGRGQTLFKGEYNKSSNEWNDNLRKTLGGYDESKNGVIYVTFQEFVTYFTTVFVCYAPPNYSEKQAARQTIDISYDSNTKQVSVPVIKLTVPSGGNVEWLGLSQKGLIQNDQKNNKQSQLDLCLFVLKSSNGQKVDLSADEPAGFIPMSTQRNKFVQFGASDDDVKQNDLSSTNSWKNSDKLSEGTYWLIPWTSGNRWESDIKSNDDDNDDDNKNNNDINSRYVGLTVHGSSNNAFSLQPIDGYSGNQIDDVLTSFAFKYGDKKQWNDLERRHFQMGQLDIYCAKNTGNDKNVNVSMTASQMTNVSNVSGYHDFKVGQEKIFKVETEQSVLFAVQVPKDCNKEYSLAYKYSFKNEYL